MNDKEYWNKRAEQRILMGEKTASELLTTMKTVYNNSLKDINKEIEAFYGRYAENNNLTLTEVNKRLNPSELKSAKEEIKRYYDKVNEVAKNSNGKIDASLLRKYKDELRLQSAKAYMSRLEELKASLKDITVNLGIKESEAFYQTLEKIYSENYSYARYDIDKYKGFSTGFEGLNYKQLNTAIHQKWLGMNYSDRIWQNKGKLLEQLNTTFLQGVAQGHNPRKIAESMKKNYGTAYHNCERLARTECNHISNEATYQSYKDNGISRYQFLATLDNRTSEICQSLDNEVFELKEKEVGVNYPPMHPNCRSTTIPYFEPDKMFEEAERVARDENGKLYYVPASINYEEWQEMTSHKPTMSVNKVVKYVKEEKPEYYDEDFKNFLDDSNKEWKNITNNKIDLNKLIDSLEKIDKYDVVNPIKMADKDIIKQASEYYNKHRNNGVYVQKIVNVKDIETRQDWLDRSKLEDFAKGFEESKYKGDEIRGIEYKGHIILVDGNHRTAIALLRNQKTIKIEILQ